MVASHQEIQEEAERRLRIRYAIQTNEGNTSLEGMSNARENDHRGMPKFLTRLQIHIQSGQYASIDLTDTMLECLHTLLGQYLGKAAPVSVRIELAAAAPPAPEMAVGPRGELFPLAAGPDADPEKDAIKARMLAGR